MAILRKTYNEGEVIFRQGDKAKCMYDVRRGMVGIYSNYDTEEETLLVKLERGACFGEMGLIDNSPRSATAVALEEGTRVLVITEETFSDYLQENPEKVIKIMQQMSSRIRALTQDYLEACRAVSEAVESEKNGSEKSGWFRSNMKRFIDAYDSSMKEAADAGVYPMTHSMGMWY